MCRRDAEIRGKQSLEGLRDGIVGASKRGRESASADRRPRFSLWVVILSKAKDPREAIASAEITKQSQIIEAIAGAYRTEAGDCGGPRT